MINICIPMAGLGSRFEFTHKEPKPLIDVNGKPMVKAVIDCIKPKGDHRFIFMTNKEMDQEWEISRALKAWEPTSKTIQLEHQTEGALCTVLSAASLLNNEDELLISNCDQIIEFDINKFYEAARKSKADGVILTYRSKERHHSFAKVRGGYVVECAEKIVISNHATIGLYWFRHGRDFVNAAAEKVGSNDREPNGEFYNCPVYNRIIKNGLKVKIHEVNKKVAYTIGTPETLREYLDHIK